MCPHPDHRTSWRSPSRCRRAHGAPAGRLCADLLNGRFVDLHVTCPTRLVVRRTTNAPGPRKLRIVSGACGDVILHWTRRRPRIVHRR